MAGQKFFDLLAQATVGAKGPTNVSRLAADANGNLLVSIKGGSFVPVGGGTTLPETLLLADSVTNTAPDGVVEKHLTSGTPAAGFGITDAVELQSAGGTNRRVMTDVTQLTTATDAAEVARRDIQVMSAGALQKICSFGPDPAIATPMIYLGDPTGANGLRNSSANRVDLVINNTAYIQCNGGVVTINVPISVTGAGTFTGKVLSSDSMKQGANLTDANLSKDVSNGSEFTLPTATLTASRTLTLAVTGSPVTNQIIRVTRLDVTANTYVVKDDAATTLLTFPVSLKGAADFKFNGTHFVLDRYWVLN